MRVVFIVDVRVEVAARNDRARVYIRNELACVRHLKRGPEGEHEVGHLVVCRDAVAGRVLIKCDQFALAAVQAGPDSDLVCCVGFRDALACELKLEAHPAVDFFGADDAHVLLFVHKRRLSHEKARGDGSFACCGAVNS